MTEQLWSVRTRDWLGYAIQGTGGHLAVIDNAGVGGEGSASIASRVAADVVAQSPDFCCVLAGTNDVGNGSSAAAIIANLTDIYDELQTAGIGIVAVTIPPRTGLDVGEDQILKDVNAWMRANVESGWTNAYLGDWSDALSENADESDPVDAYLLDGVHFNETGARAGGMALRATIQRVVDSLS